jgi:hypothetical protein
MVPQGLFGSLLGQYGGALGGLAGAPFGQPNIGQQFGQGLGQLAQHYLPFAATPQIAPQGLFGDVFSQLAPTIGGGVGGIFGQQGLGQQVGQGFGRLAQQYLPFAALPQIAQQYQPYGVTPQIAQQQYPQQQYPQQQYPQQQYPQQQYPQQQYQQQAYPQQQIVPQGLFGSILGQLAPTIGGGVGGIFGQSGLGQQVGQGLGQLAQQYLPFAATPQQQAEPQVAIPVSVLQQLLQAVVQLAAAQGQIPPQAWTGDTGLASLH